jgi:hypothetical protein
MISYEEHLGWGPKLAALQNELTQLSVDVSNAAGKSSHIAALTFRVTRALSQLRCELDSELNRLVPDGDSRTNGILEVYYPPQESRARISWK